VPDHNAFESRLADAMRRYAQRVPVDVDALALAREIADPSTHDAGHGRRWWPLRNARTGMGTTRAIPDLGAAAVAAALVVAIGGALLGALLFAQRADAPGASADQPGTFSPAGSLTAAREGHTATLLPDGRVLVIGGGSRDDGHALGSVEAWDPVSFAFSPAGSLTAAREGHTATLLSDGRVLVIGGYDGGDQVFASAEVRDPASGSFSAAATLQHARSNHTATLLPDGRVLVVGGWDGTGQVGEAAI